MSVKRSVIAEVLNMDQEDIRCDKCALMRKGSECRFWHEVVKKDSFCSFYSTEDIFEGIGEIEEIEDEEAV